MDIGVIKVCRKLYPETTLHHVEKDTIYALSAMLLWSTVASAFKISLGSMPPATLLLFSSSFSTLIFFVILLLQRRMKRSLFSKEKIKRAIPLGFLNPFLYYNLLFASYSILPAQQAQALGLSWPVMTALLSPFMHRGRTDRKSMLAVLISFSGVCVISLRIVSLAGALLALSAAFVWTIYWLENAGENTAETLFLNFMFGTLFSFVLFMLNPEIPENPLPALYIGAFEMGITFFLWQKALSLSKNITRTANMIYLMPFISLLFIHGVLNERIEITTIPGLLLIIGGVLLQTKR
jgi:drug/metabolite transporter (DMT)-like permease